MAIFGLAISTRMPFLTFRCSYTLPKEPAVESGELLQMVCRFVIAPSDTAVRSGITGGENAGN